MALRRKAPADKPRRDPLKMKASPKIATAMARKAIRLPLSVRITSHSICSRSDSYQSSKQQTEASRALKHNSQANRKLPSKYSIMVRFELANSNTLIIFLDRSILNGYNSLNRIIHQNNGDTQRGMVIPDSGRSINN